jgi:hypothetical protein
MAPNANTEIKKIKTTNQRSKSASTFERQDAGSENLGYLIEFIKEPWGVLRRRTLAVPQQSEPQLALVRGFQGRIEVVRGILLTTGGLTFDVVTDDARATSQQLITDFPRNVVFGQPIEKFNQAERKIIQPPLKLLFEFFFVTLHFDC